MCPDFGTGQCDQKIFFQIANKRCQNRQKIARIFCQLFKIAKILSQNRHLNPAFLCFIAFLLTKFFRVQKIFYFFPKSKDFLSDFWQPTPNFDFDLFLLFKQASLTKKGKK